MAKPYFEVFRIKASCVSRVREIPVSEIVAPEKKEVNVTPSDQSKVYLPEVAPSSTQDTPKMSNGAFLSDAREFAEYAKSAKREPKVGYSTQASKVCLPNN